MTTFVKLTDEEAEEVSKQVRKRMRETLEKYEVSFNKELVSQLKNGISIMDKMVIKQTLEVGVSANLLNLFLENRKGNSRIKRAPISTSRRKKKFDRS
jgi:hypothetical protein